MKKNLLIAGLVLTIATSVISGTMAAYNATVDFVEDTVVAKNFVLTATKDSDTFVGSAQKIAPGEQKEILFTVSNKDGETVTETGMDIVIDVDITEDGIAPLSYTLYNAKNMDEALVVTVADNKSFTYDGLSFEPGVAGEESYVLLIEWPHTDNDTAYQGNSYENTVAITVSGTQK